MNQILNSNAALLAAKMKKYFMDESQIKEFITYLKQDASVIAPHKKGEVSYSFGEVSDVNEVVLDYPRTIQPLKKFFLPPREELLSFNIKANDFKETEIAAEKKIFFAIHSYEMQSIKRLDYNLTQGNPESNYLTRRENAIFIGISYEPDEYHFSKSVGIEIEDMEGFALFFNKIDSGYNVYVVNEDGQSLMDGFGKAKALEVNGKFEEKEFQAKIRYHYNRLPNIFDHVYKSKVWEKVAEKCLGCGTCNLLCPTCYCFDVNDEVALDMAEGTRERTWDSCMINPFAEVAGGENFREYLSGRTRHRLYRKFKYITEKSGKLQCVGCGRCSKYCPAGISMTEIVNDLINEYQDIQNKPTI
jgi:sulfhydrogenase subunit beta (sulfur reductase)